jgi:DinB superfamily
MSEPISLTRDQYLDSIRHSKASAIQLGEKLTMTQLTWQPKGGERWSVAECFDHLAAATEVFLDAMEPAVRQAPPGANASEFRTAGLLSKKLVRDTEPPPRTKLPSPAKLLPRPTLNPEGILPRFLESMDRLSVLVGSTAGKDLNAVRFHPPLIPLLRITAGSGLLLVEAHVRRHLWQAGQVTQDPDFPR